MSKESFQNKDGQIIIIKMIKTIQENKEFLSEVDGLIGDGDHGINMNKGFTLCEKALKEKDISGLRDSIKTLGIILMTEIGGSMGPLYGSLFRSMAKALIDIEEIDKHIFAQMIRNGLNKIKTIGNAQIGDKTLIDTLEPAVDIFEKAVVDNKSFEQALSLLDKEAKKGQESTKNMVAKIGRSARLGERSRGVLDAGATSCYLLLHSICESIKILLNS